MHVTVIQLATAVGNEYTKTGGNVWTPFRHTCTRYQQIDTDKTKAVECWHTRENWKPQKICETISWMGLGTIGVCWEGLRSPLDPHWCFLFSLFFLGIEQNSNLFLAAASTLYLFKEAMATPSPPRIHFEDHSTVSINLTWFSLFSTLKYPTARISSWSRFSLSLCEQYLIIIQRIFRETDDISYTNSNHTTGTLD